MQQFSSRASQLFGLFPFFHQKALVTSWNLADPILWLQQNRTVRDRLMCAEWLIIQRDAEESRKTECFIPTQLLQMPTKHFGTHIDAENDLG